MALHDPQEDKVNRQIAKQRPGKSFPKPPKSNSPVKFDLKGKSERGKLRF